MIPSMQDLVCSIHPPTTGRTPTSAISIAVNRERTSGVTSNSGQLLNLINRSPLQTGQLSSFPPQAVQRISSGSAAVGHSLHLPAMRPLQNPPYLTAKAARIFPSHAQQSPAGLDSSRANPT